MSAAAAKPRSVRLRQGAVLIVGAALFWLLIGADRADFAWTPLGLGIVYLATALAGGPDGGHWSTACVLVGWGLGVVADAEGWWDRPAAPSYLLGAGLGLCAAAALRRAGVTVTLEGLAATLTAGAALYVLQPELDLVANRWVFAVGLAAIGVANVALAARRA